MRNMQKLIVISKQLNRETLDFYRLSISGTAFFETIIGDLKGNVKFLTIKDNVKFIEQLAKEYGVIPRYQLVNDQPTLEELSNAALYNSVSNKLLSKVIDEDPAKLQVVSGDAVNIIRNRAFDTSGQFNNVVEVDVSYQSLSNLRNLYSELATNELFNYMYINSCMLDFRLDEVYSYLETTETTKDNVLRKIELYYMLGEVIPILELCRQVQKYQVEHQFDLGLYPIAHKILNEYQTDYNNLYMKVPGLIAVDVKTFEDPKFSLEKFISNDLSNMMRADYPLKHLHVANLVRNCIKQEIVNINFLRESILLLGPDYRGANRYQAKVMSSVIIEYVASLEDVDLSIAFYDTLPYSLYVTSSILGDKITGSDTKRSERVSEIIDIQRYDGVPKAKLVASKRPGNKIAVCVCGMARNEIEETLKSLKEMFDESLTVDFFVHTWQEREDYPGIGGIGAGPDRIWNEKYFKAGMPNPPSEIYRVHQLEAVLPTVAKVLCTPVRRPNVSATYEAALGSNLKAFEMEDDIAFEKTLFTDTFQTRGNFNQAKMIYGIYKSFKLVDDYEKETGEKYRYVVKFRSDSQFTRKLDQTTFDSIGANDLLAHVMGRGADDLVNISQFHTAKRVMRIWRSSKKYNALSPFYQDGKHMNCDSHKLAFANMLYHQVNLKNYNKSLCTLLFMTRVQMPDITAAMKQDKIERLSPEINQYFEQLMAVHSKPLGYNNHLDKINDISCELVSYDTEKLALKIVVTGNSLLSIGSEKFGLIANNVMDKKTYSYEKSYTNMLTVVEQSDQKIVFNKMYGMNVLNNGQSWELSLKIADGTDLFFPISFNSFKQFEINNGRVYIEQNANKTVEFGKEIIK